MRILLKYFTTPLVTGAVAAAPTAAAAPTETCTGLNTGSTLCQSPGNAEVNDTLPFASVLPQWSDFGGQSGGPYGGSFGGGSR
jgi:hypothetical protein